MPNKMLLKQQRCELREWPQPEKGARTKDGAGKRDRGDQVGREGEAVTTAPSCPSAPKAQRAWLHHPAGLCKSGVAVSTDGVLTAQNAACWAAVSVNVTEGT